LIALDLPRRLERLPAVELVSDEGPHVVPSDRLDRQRVAALGLKHYHDIQLGPSGVRWRLQRSQTLE
jgi:hypothetical protein